MDKVKEWWSERIIFGLLLIVGFVGLTAAGMLVSALTKDQLQFGRDGLLVLGPVVGMIAAAIWKTDKADKQNAATLATLASTAADALSSPAAPTPPAPRPADDRVQQLVDALIDPATGTPRSPIPYKDLDAVDATLFPAQPAPAPAAPPLAPVVPVVVALLAWGAKVSPFFRSRVREIAAVLGIDPDWLMAAIAFETARTFSPSIKNPHSTATGLLQFMEATAVELGTTTAALAAMSAENQLNFVLAYMRQVIARHGPLRNLGDVYMAILNPSMIGKPDSATMWVLGASAYAANAGLDTDKDHVITRAEAVAHVAATLAEGLKPPNAA